MFKSLMSRVPERAEGVLGMALVSLDGIAIEKISNDPSLNLDTIIAELTDRLKRTNLAASEMGTGPAREMVTFTERAVVILKGVHEDYYLLCAVEPDGNYGKVRHAIRMVVPDLAQELV